VPTLLKNLLKVVYLTGFEKPSHVATAAFENLLMTALVAVGKTNRYCFYYIFFNIVKKNSGTSKQKNIKISKLSNKKHRINFLDPKKCSIW
jgi:hypothetical protein